MNFTNKITKTLFGMVFSFGFVMATNSFGFLCRAGIFEEPTAPEAIIKK